MGSYSFLGGKWGGSAMPGTSGGQVTWSFATANRSGFDAYSGYTVFDAALNPAAYNAVRTAFTVWEAVANIDFVEMPDSATVNIRIGLDYIDGQPVAGSNTLGQAQNWTENGIYQVSTVVFDTADIADAWYGYGPGALGQWSFMTVAEHEIGHVLGLGHTDDPDTLMYPVTGLVVGPEAGDIAGVQYLYGAPAVAPAPGLILPGIVRDGLDTDYYRLHNPDVATAGIDPVQHYHTWGWHEGRDPNAWFDTDAYLLHNPDVAAAGIDPYQHYRESGWREGRAPSDQFDADAYLAANPDVALAGMPPLEHWLLFGASEGRALTV
ncbi:MAG: matrixin family metalloprotease [Nitrospira sp.]|nr:matrixin family metalloprotease [Nitrospira sp.]